jgi:hypothetical protein
VRKLKTGSVATEKTLEEDMQRFINATLWWIQPLKLTQLQYKILLCCKVPLSLEAIVKIKLTRLIPVRCINQDDLIEKGQQVQLMTRVYKQAEQVHIWLGGEDRFTQRP